MKRLLTIFVILLLFTSCAKELEDTQNSMFFGASEKWDYADEQHSVCLFMQPNIYAFKSDDSINISYTVGIFRAHDNILYLTPTHTLLIENQVLDTYSSSYENVAEYRYSTFKIPIKEQITEAYPFTFVSDNGMFFYSDEFQLRLSAWYVFDLVDLIELCGYSVSEEWR